MALRLAGDGARVAVNGRAMDDRMAEVVELTGGIAAPADCADPVQVGAMVTRLEAEVGAVDVLVSNHASMSMGSLLDYEMADWWRVVDTNLGGTFHLVQATLPGMRHKGQGRVVVVTSEWGVIGWPNATAYAASKAGLIALVKTLARELAPAGVIVNAVAPGVIDTPQLEVDARDAGLSLKEMHAVYAADIPAGRIGRPEEIAATVAFLADSRVSALVGQTIQANGGSTRSRV